MHKMIIFPFVILLPTQVYGANQIYSVPFTPTIDPWLAPSEGVLISENAPVYIARKNGNDVDFQKYDNLIKPAMDYAMQLPQYKRADINSFIRKTSQSRIQNKSHNSHARPSVLYPELIIVVANDLYQKFNKDIWRTIPYIVAFYNGVDTVYRELQNPKIRLNIAAIIIEDEYGVFEYLENSSVDPSKVKGDSINDAFKFWYKQKDTFPMDTYDEIISMTARAFCQEDGDKPDNCQEGVAGRSAVATICEYSDTYKDITKSLVVKDNGKFSGVYAAAHELGHALGASHDMSYRSNEQGNYDDIPRCNGSYYVDVSSYIMFPSLTLSTGQRFWSDCTLDYFQRFLRERNHTCLHNVPASGQHEIPRLMPGKIVGSLDNLCKTTGLGKSCHDINRCTRRLCEHNETDDSCILVPSAVLDGVSCDDDDPTKFCMVGKCVSASDFK